MMKLIEYSITDDIKKELGYIIKQTRLLNYLEAKKNKVIEKNPFTKENFCDNNSICHYHTLTKLENDIVKEDNFYHIFLNKLGYYFQIESDDHEKNMDILFNLKDKVIRALEYLEQDVVLQIQTEMENLDFEADCIAKVYFNLLKFTYEVVVRNKMTINSDEILVFLNFYQGIYKVIAYYSLTLYYINYHNLDKALNLYQKAKKYCDKEGVSFGLCYYPLLEIYIAQNNYVDSLKLAKELEEYYLKMNNINRLVSIYNFLADYYLVLDSIDSAREYYNKSENLSLNNGGISNTKLYYNWGNRLMVLYKYNEAKEYFIKALNKCNNIYQKTRIINRLMIIYTLLNEKEPLKDLLVTGKQYFDYASIIEQNIFKYFVYKSDNSRYYRKFALDRIMPELKEDANSKVILLFFYQDLYDK